MLEARVGIELTRKGFADLTLNPLIPTNSKRKIDDLTLAMKYTPPKAGLLSPYEFAASDFHPNYGQ